MPLVTPNVRWRAYVGARPSETNTRFGLGQPQRLVASVGGKFVAKDTITQATAWETEILGAGTVVGFADLTGDGHEEVVVQTAAQAHVLDGQNGTVIWSSPLSSIETMGAARLVDLNHDGLTDLYLDNGIGAKPGTEVAAAYTFAGGVTQKLWGLPLTIEPQLLNSGTDTLVDLDDDGLYEVVLPSWNSVLLVRGEDGSTISLLDHPTATGNPFPQAGALAAELDPAPGRELIVVQPNASEASQIAPGVAVYSVDVQGGQGSLLWSADAGTIDAEVSVNADIAADVNGDGYGEVVFSFRSASTGDVWTTQLLNGSDGSLIAELSDARFEGSADLDAAGGAEIVIATTSGLEVYSFDSATDDLVLLAEVPGQRALMLVDSELKSRGPVSSRLAVVPTSNGAPMLLTGVASGAPTPQSAVNAFTEVHGHIYGQGALHHVGAFSPVVGAVTGAIRADFATRPYPQVALGTSEGLVVVLDGDLEVTNGFTWIDCEQVGSFVGAGGLRPPAVVDTDAVGPFVVLPETALGTVVADATHASLIVPPVPRWWREQLRSPSIISVNGQPSVVGIEGDALVSRSAASSALLASVAMPAGWIWGTPIPLAVAGESDSHIGVDWRVDGMQIVQTSVNLSTQTVSWQSAPIAFGGYFGSSAGDVDGDGTDEWYSLQSNLYRRDASQGNVVTVATFPQLGYSLPMISSFQGSAPELLLQAGGQGPKLVEPTGNVVWQSSTNEPVNGMAGARTSCAGASRFVTPAVSSPYLRAYDGTSGQLVAASAYAEGVAFASAQDALDAGKRPGMFQHTTSVADLGGQGPAVLAASSDGFLYAVSACDLHVMWAANLGTSLGEPIVADVDGDDGDEILVGGANGFVYALDNLSCSAPFITLSGEAPAGLEIAAGDSVAMAWEAIDGALSYEVALVTPDDKPVWDPAYVPVQGTTATIDMSGALANRPYKVVVRGVTASGPGQEGFSKAITLKDATPPVVQLEAEGGERAAIKITANDDVALDHVRVSVVTDAGPHPVDDALLQGQADGAEILWAPATELWGSDVEIAIEVFDSGLLKTTVSRWAHITSDGLVAWGDPTSPGTVNPLDVSDPSETVPSRRSESAESGCSVTTSADPDGTRYALLLGGLALGLLRSRRLKRSNMA